MAETDTPWEPPLAGTELEHLLGALDRLRATFRWKADGLDAAGLHTRVGASSLDLGGLLKHLALVEELTTTWKLRGTWPGSSGRRSPRTAGSTGRSPRRPTTTRPTSTPSGTTRWRGPARGSPTAGSTSRPT